MRATKAESGKRPAVSVRLKTDNSELKTARAGAQTNSQACRGIKGASPCLVSPLFLARHRPRHEFPNLRFHKGLHLLLGLGRPVGLAGVYIPQTGRDIRIASGKSLDQFAPARGERLDAITRRVLVEGGLYVGYQLTPCLRYLRLKLGRPFFSALVELRPRLRAVVFVCPIGVVLHSDLLDY